LAGSERTQKEAGVARGECLDRVCGERDDMRRATWGSHEVAMGGNAKRSREKYGERGWGCPCFHDAGVRYVQRATRNGAT
jgi:hypothetical protein